MRNVFDKKQAKLLCNFFLLSQFNCWSITWLFCNKTSYVKIEHKKKSFTNSAQWASHVFGRTTESRIKHQGPLQAHKYLGNWNTQHIFRGKFLFKWLQRYPNPQPLSSYTCRSVWLNGWVIVYEQSGYGFESRWIHLNFIYRTCFEQGVPWHSGNYKV